MVVIVLGYGFHAEREEPPSEDEGVVEVVDGDGLVEFGEDFGGDVIVAFDGD